MITLLKLTSQVFFQQNYSDLNFKANITTSRKTWIDAGFSNGPHTEFSM